MAAPRSELDVHGVLNVFIAGRVTPKPLMQLLVIMSEGVTTLSLTQKHAESI